MIVMKFGGSSLESAEAIDRAVNIVESRRARKPLVVVSAMGKTTNALLHLATTAAKRDESAVREQISALRKFHEDEGAKVARAAGGCKYQNEYVLGTPCRLLDEKTAASDDDCHGFAQGRMRD